MYSACHASWCQIIKWSTVNSWAQYFIIWTQQHQETQHQQQTQDISISSLSRKYDIKTKCSKQQSKCRTQEKVFVCRKQQTYQYLACHHVDTHYYQLQSLSVFQNTETPWNSLHRHNMAIICISTDHVSKDKHILINITNNSISSI